MNRSDAELVKLAKEGSEEAKEILLERCEGVLSYNVQKYKSMSWVVLNRFDIEDLISECHITVLESIEHYDPNRDSGFSNFVKFNIRNRILNLLRRRTLVSRIHKTLEGAPTATLEGYLRKVRDNYFRDEKQKNKIEEIISSKTLTSQEKIVIAMMLDGDSQTEIAQKLGVTKGRISQILKDFKRK